MFHFHPVSLAAVKGNMLIGTKMAKGEITKIIHVIHFLIQIVYHLTIFKVNNSESKAYKNL